MNTPTNELLAWFNYVWPDDGNSPSCLECRFYNPGKRCVAQGDEEPCITARRGIAALIERSEKVDVLVEEEIAKIESDERYHYKPADVFINAPLALIQVSMAGQMHILKMVQAALKAKQ